MGKIKSKTGLRVFTYADIESWKPCYSPDKHLPGTWRGTALDILDHKDIPHQDKLWVVLRIALCSERTMRLFAVWAYRQTLQWVQNPDPRSIAAVDVAERFANARATQSELTVAAQAAEVAAQAAAWSMKSMVWSAWSAWSVAVAEAKGTKSVAWAARWAAQSAVWSAVAESEGAKSAADVKSTWATVWSTWAETVWPTVKSSAKSAADVTKGYTEQAQLSKLREMLLAEGVERLAAKRAKKVKYRSRE